MQREWIERNIQRNSRKIFPELRKKKNYEIESNDTILKRRIKKDPKLSQYLETTQMSMPG